MNCEEVVKRNTGLSRWCKMPGLIKGMITLPRGTTITPANFVSLAAWRTLQLNPYATRAYFWPWFRSMENLSEESQYEITAISAMFIRNGKYTWRFSIKESLCLHTKLYTHNSEGDVDIIFIDVNNNFIGTVDEDGNIRGLSVDLINAEKMVISDGAVSTKSPIYVCLADNTELDERGVMSKNNFVNQMYRIVDVTITDVSHTTNDVRVVDVATECDAVPVQGLVAADFVVRDADGLNPVTPSLCVEDSNIPGRYTITSTDDFVVGGTLDLVAPASLSIKAYECPEALEIDSIA